MGDPGADLIFVGEGPGADEDAAGLPFVGRSGKLLDRLIAEEMDLTRADCYIANVVKCRPPANRNPRPDEMAACRSWLDAQLDHVDPKVVVTLGNVATRALLGSTEGITRLRGRTYPWRRPASWCPPTIPAPSCGAIPGPWPACGPTWCGPPWRWLSGAQPGADRMTLAVETIGVDQTRALAASVAELVRSGDIVLLAGELGAGKTAFAQGFAAGLGIDEPVTSPTFTLVRTYTGRLRLHHVDVYRLENLQEALDLDLAELIDDGGVTLVEWGDAVAPALPAEFLEVSLDYGADDDRRTVVLRPVGRRWSATRRS